MFRTKLLVVRKFWKLYTGFYVGKDCLINTRLSCQCSSVKDVFGNYIVGLFINSESDHACKISVVCCRLIALEICRFWVPRAWLEEYKGLNWVPVLFNFSFILSFKWLFLPYSLMHLLRAQGQAKQVTSSPFFFSSPGDTIQPEVCIMNSGIKKDI